MLGKYFQLQEAINGTMLLGQITSDEVNYIYATLKGAAQTVPKLTSNLALPSITMTDVLSSPISGNEDNFTPVHYSMAHGAVREPQPSAECFRPANIEMHSKIEMYPSQPEYRDDDTNSSNLSDFIPPMYDEALLGIKTKIVRQQEAPRRHGVPEHWRSPWNNLGKLIFNVLYLMSFGHAGLEPLWGAIVLEKEGDESVWAEQTQQTIDRLKT
ncbi:hypothetical protein GYMLUDRAFT_53769 [Collybiopsis luxurians FD-317 M1]|nr:hypothetical protein GYMLUDRAFT_53769 [Collybiopsis luxurians FD-317 M1]